MTYMIKHGRHWKSLGDDQVSSGGGVGAQIGAQQGCTQDANGNMTCPGSGSPFDFSVLSQLFSGMPDADPAADPSLVGGSTVTSSDFNCVKYPGICKPMNLRALQTVQALQAQMNRVAQVKGMGKIAVDGAIGPGTLALFNQVAAASQGTPYVMSPVGSTPLLAADADVYASQCAGLANALGAPAQVSAPSANSPVTLVNRAGAELKAPKANQDMAGAGILAAFNGMSTVAQVAVVGIGGFAVLKFMKKRKGRR